MHQPEQWIAIEKMAKRLGRSHGHVARLCRNQLAPAGLARKIKEPDGGKASWFISAAWRPRQRARLWPAQTLASIGGETIITIRITPPGHLTVDVFGSGSKAG